MMKHTLREQEIARYEKWLRKHQENLEGLLDGTLGESDMWVYEMSVGRAIEMERKNVAYCAARLSELQEA
jgi:hypothetical protein